MTSLYLNKVSIENFRCFTNQEIELACPDGKNRGSGLNILIGENGNGKTSILEGINFLSKSSYEIENRITIGDFNDEDCMIKVKGITSDFNCSMPFPGYFECNGIEITAKNRKRHVLLEIIQIYSL